jgi:tetratricopeptide (TPR) repeat protein
MSIKGIIAGFLGLSHGHYRIISMDHRRERTNVKANANMSSAGTHSSEITQNEENFNERTFFESSAFIEPSSGQVISNRTDYEENLFENKLSNVEEEKTISKLILKSREQNLADRREVLSKCFELKFFNLQIHFQKQVFDELIPLFKIKHLKDDVNDNGVEKLIEVEKRVSAALYKCVLSKNHTPLVSLTYLYADILEHLWLLPYVVDDRSVYANIVEKNGRVILNQADKWLLLIEKDRKINGELQVNIAMIRTCLSKLSPHLLKKTEEKISELKSQLDDSVVIGKIYQEAGDFERAKYHYLQRIEEINAQTYGDVSSSSLSETAKTSLIMEGELCGNIGMCCYELKNYDQALKYHQQFLNIFSETKDALKVASGYQELGKIYCATHNYDQALDCYSKSLELSETVPQLLPLLPVNLVKIGDVYVFLKNYKKAMDYYRLGEKQALKQGDERTSMEAFFKQANVHIIIEEYKEAINCYLMLIESPSQSISSVEFTKVYSGLSVAYFLVGEYERSINYFRRALNNDGINLLKNDFHKIFFHICNDLQKEPFRFLIEKIEAISFRKIDFSYDQELILYFQLFEIFIEFYIKNDVYSFKSEKKLTVPSKEAIKVFKKIQNIQQTEQKFEISIADFLNYIGNFLVKGNRKEAEFYLESSLILKNKLSPHNPLLMRDLAVIFLKEGKFDKAINILLRALKVGKDIEENISLQVVLWNHLGVAYTNLKHEEEAIYCYKQTLQYPTKDESIKASKALALNNFGNLLMGKGLLEEAQIKYKEALKLKKEIYTEGFHPQLASAYNNLLTSLTKDSLGEEINALLKEVESFLLLIPPSYDKINELYYNLGSFFERIENYDQAKIFFEKGCRFKEQSNDTKDKLLIAAMYHKLGYICSDFEEKYQHFSKALPIYQKIYGNLPCQEIADTYWQQGLALSNTKGKETEANGCFQKAKEMYQELNK